MQNLETKFKIDIKQKCYQSSLKIIAITDKLPNKRSAWIITDQLIRSATSIGANLVEASASISRLEFKKFFEISLKSANETKYWLGLLKDTKLAKIEDIETLLAETDHIANILAKSIISLKKR